MVMLIAGTDEVGRGALAGPVYAAAVILAADHGVCGLADSKQLTARRREVLAVALRERALAWAVASASVEEIDRLNILRATLLAMQRAVAALSPRPQLCLVDGDRAPELSCPSRTVVGGDRSEPAIMAASILAKVARDAEMVRLDATYPDYRFARHKGYGTPEHLAALRAHGPCAIHRMSFAPCARSAPVTAAGMG